MDPIQDVWVLDWVSGRLLDDPGRAFDGNNFYPARGSILYCDPLLGPSLLVLPLRVLGLDNPVLLYNLAILATLTLAAYGFYRLAFSLSGDRGAALLAGIAIPFTAHQLSHVHQLNLLTLTGLPWLLWGLLRLVERPTPGAALVTAGAFVFQAGTSGYHAFTSAFLCLVVAAWGWRSFGSKRTLAAVGLAAVVAAAALAPYLVGFLRHRADSPMGRSLEEAAARSVDVATGLFRSNTYVWRDLMPPGGMPLFPGLVVLAFGLFGVVKVRTRQARLLKAVAAVFLVLSFGPELRAFGRPLLTLPFTFLFQHLPLFGAVRRPILFAVTAIMALTLLGVLGLQAAGLARRRWLLAGLLAAAVAESVAPGFPRSARTTELPEAYGYLQGQPPGGILELPLSDDDNTRYQWWSVHHGLPIVNGMAAFEPRWYQRLYQWVGREWRRQPARQDMEGWRSVEAVKELPIRYLVLHRGVSGYAQSNVDATTRTFTLLHETADGDRVYRVDRGGTIGGTLTRRFRAEQLHRGPLRLRLTGPTGATVQVRFEGTWIGAVELAGGEQRAEVIIPERLVRDGDLTLTRAGGDPAMPVELLELEESLGSQRGLV